MIIYPRAHIDNILCVFFIIGHQKSFKSKKKKNLKCVLDKTLPFINICVITYNLKAKQITKV